MTLNRKALKVVVTKAAAFAGLDLQRTKMGYLRLRHRYLGPREARASWYDRVYAEEQDAYACHYSQSPYLAVWNELAKRVTSEDSIVEIGCGTGQLAELLRDRGISRYIGFDFSGEAIRLARRRLSEVQFEVGDALQTPLLLNETFSTVLCTEVLEHINEDLAVLARIPPGVRVLATVPNYFARTHVRWFSTADEVVNRYAPVFSELTVTPCKLGSGSSVLYLLDGVIVAA